MSKETYIHVKKERPTVSREGDSELRPKKKNWSLVKSLERQKE